MGLIERAIELAKAGESLEQIERALKKEGFSSVSQHLDAPSLRRQLRALGRTARAEPPVARGRPPGRTPDPFLSSEEDDRQTQPG